MKTVHIIYAPRPEEVWQRQVQFSTELTVEQVLQQSGLYEEFPSLLNTLKGVGVFGQVKSLGEIVADGDRVEVYRELNFDPMESRRRRATHKKSGILKKKHLKPDRSKRFDYIEHKDKVHKRREYE